MLLLSLKREIYSGFAGKLNFYLSVVDDKIKGEHDNPTIELLICHDKNKVVTEYALKDESQVFVKNIVHLNIIILEHNRI